MTVSFGCLLVVLTDLAFVLLFGIEIDELTAARIEQELAARFGQLVALIEMAQQEPAELFVVRTAIALELAARFGQLAALIEMAQRVPVELFAEHIVIEQEPAAQFGQPVALIGQAFVAWFGISLGALIDLVMLAGLIGSLIAEPTVNFATTASVWQAFCGYRSKHIFSHCFFGCSSVRIDQHIAEHGFVFCSQLFFVSIGFAQFVGFVAARRFAVLDFDLLLSLLSPYGFHVTPSRDEPSCLEQLKRRIDKSFFC